MLLEARFLAKIAYEQATQIWLHPNPYQEQVENSMP